MKKVVMVMLLAFLSFVPEKARAQFGATVIVQGGNVANVNANNDLEVEVRAGATAITATGSSLNVNVTNSSSGSSSTDEGAFTEGTTTLTVAGCEFTTGSTALSTAHAGAFLCDADRTLHVDAYRWGNTVLGAATNFGTTPGAVVAGQVNSSTFIGTTAAVAASAGVQKVGISGNTGVAVDAATGAAPPANALLIAGLGSGATGGFMTALPVADTYKAISINTATTTLIVTGVSGRQVRIGAFELDTAGADNIEWIEGTGATCGTGTTGMDGGTTSGTGYVFLANGSIARGSGVGTVLSTITAGDSVCLVTSAAIQLSGGLQYVIF